MDVQMRRHDERIVPPAASPAGGGGGLEQARLQAQRVLDATDAVINNALSDNAEEFMAAARQQGGGQ